jgi:hypothetical protein
MGGYMAASGFGIRFGGCDSAGVLAQFCGVVTEPHEPPRTQRITKDLVSTESSD